MDTINKVASNSNVLTQIETEQKTIKLILTIASVLDDVCVEQKNHSNGILLIT